MFSVLPKIGLGLGLGLGLGRPMSRKAKLESKRYDDEVEVGVRQSVTANHSLDVKTYDDPKNYDDIIIKTAYSQKFSLEITEDINISSAEGDINGAIVDVNQSIDIDQFSRICINVWEWGDDLFVYVNVFESTIVKQHTDVDVLLTNDGVFNVDIDQTVALKQTNQTEIVIKGDVDIDLDVLLAQTALVNQTANVVFEGTPDNFTVSVDANQDAVLNQQVLIGVSSGDLGLA